MEKDSSHFIAWRFAFTSAPGAWVCPLCGARNGGKFCTECGWKKEDR